MTELTAVLLSAGPPIVIGGLYESDLISIRIDAVQRASGASQIGVFHYQPVIVHTAGQVHESHRLLLEVYGFILSWLQGRAPEEGIVWRAKGKSSAVPLSRGLKKGKHILDDLTNIQSTACKFTLILNAHCKICEFKDRCRARAIVEDNLSLLRGISRMEIDRLNKKGNQLSYAFCPRRISKRAKNLAYPRYFALQACAIREQKTLIHGRLKLDATTARIYLDIEGMRTTRFYYLIGLLVSRSGAIHKRSFWANNEDEGLEIFIEMLDYITNKETVLYFTTVTMKFDP